MFPSLPDHFDDDSDTQIMTPTKINPNNYIHVSSPHISQRSDHFLEKAHGVSPELEEDREDAVRSCVIDPQTVEEMEFRSGTARHQMRHIEPHAKVDHVSYSFKKSTFRQPPNGQMSNFRYETEATETLSNFNFKHIVDLLVIVNISKDFLGCLKDCFSTFLSEVKERIGNKQDLALYLSYPSNVYFLEACQEMLLNFRLEKSASMHFEDVTLSINAISELLRCLTKLPNSSKTLDEQKLASATSHLTTSELFTFLKHFLKYKENDTSPTEFTALCQRVISRQQQAMLNTLNSQDISPLPVPPPILYQQCDKMITGLSQENKTIGEEQLIPTKSDQDSLKSCDTKSFLPHNNAAPKIPFALSKEDLEKLVNNFALLNVECQQAIRNYITILGNTEPETAAFLFKKINALYKI